jgi:nucleoid-associated protein YgaU
MGAGLIQNEDRITLLEKDIQSLSISYRNLLASAKDTQVFANQEPSQPVDKIIPNSTASLIQEDGNKLLAESKVDEVDKVAVVPAPVPVPEEALNPVLEILKNNTTSNEKEEEAVPASTVDKVVDDIPEIYTVEKGDNLSYISTKFYGDKSMAEAIMELNNLDDPNKIFFGKKLRLPRAKK